MRKKIRSEQSETLKKVLRYLKRYWFFLALSFGLAAITVASTLYIPLLTGDAVDCVIGKGQVDFTGIFAVLKRMVMVIGVTAVAQWGMNICNNKMTYQIVRDIRNEAFAKLLDSVFQDTAWDVSSDISVLHTMLAQEGLTGNDFSKKQL